MASPAGDTDVALKAEAHRLRVDNAFLAEELCSTAQQVIELHSQLQKALPQQTAVEFGNPGAYLGNLKLQNPRSKLRELQPTLRRYNFVLEHIDPAEEEEDPDEDKDPKGLFASKYRVRTSFSCLDKNELMGWGAFPAPVGTEAAAKGVHEDPGGAKPSMGYYEILLPPPRSRAPGRAGTSKKKDFSRFSYTDWSLSNVIDAKPGTTIDVGSMVKWITEAEPRTPDDTLPLFLMCKDALRNIASGLLDFRTTREVELEKQAKVVTEQRDEARARAEGLHAQCDHLQQMIATFEVQTQDMQKRLDEFASASREHVLAAQYDAEVVKTKQLESEITMVKANIGKLSETIQQKETETREAAAGYEKRLAVSLSEKVASLSEDELLQHVLTIFQRGIPWARLGPDLIAKNTELATLHSLCKLFMQRIRTEAQSWVSDLCLLLDQTPKELPLALQKWYEAENLLKLTPALNKEIKDLARNVRKKDFNLIWDVLRDALGSGTMSMESLIFHVSGKSKDDVLKAWTGLEPDALTKVLDCRADFNRWLARKDTGSWKQQRRHDRLMYLSFLDFSAVQTLHANPPPTDTLNTTVCHILELKWQWDIACRKRGRPPLSLMRVTRAYFFHAYGIRSAAELHLAEFLAGMVLHQHRLHREEEADKETEDVNHDAYHVSYRVLLFASLLRIDDTSKWREQSAQFLMQFIFEVRAVTVRLRNILNERNARDSHGAILDDSSTLAKVMGTCDFLLPSAEVIPIASSPEVMALMPQSGRNIAHIMRQSSDGANHALKRRPSMREQKNKKLLLNFDEEKAAFDDKQAEHLEAHQTELKYIVATGEAGCIWVDHLLYLLAEQWHKSNQAVETSRKESFTKFSQDTDGRMDLGDFACLVKVVSPSMEEYDVAHLYMELVDSHGNVDADEWLLVLSLYEAGLAGGGGTFLPDEPTTFLDHSPHAADRSESELLGQPAAGSRRGPQSHLAHSMTLPDLHNTVGK